MLMKESSPSRSRLGTTVGQEFLVALSGLTLVLFILAHLAGNFLIFRGPEAFNAYAHHLQSLGVVLWMARIGLLGAFVTHVALTIRLKWVSRSARDSGYAVKKYMGNTTVAKLTMLYTGLVIFLFLIYHIHDFTLRDKTGVIAEVAGENLGVYGVVWNSFADPAHSALYILAVWAVGLHFSNAVSTIWVTLGLLTESTTFLANWIARVLGILVAAGFSSIPLYVLAKTFLMGA